MHMMTNELTYDQRQERMTIMFPWNFSPLNKDTLRLLKQMKPEEVERFVQDTMGKMFPQSMQGMMNPHDFMKSFQSDSSSTVQQDHKEKHLRSSVFETHDFVYAMIPIEAEDWLQNLKLYYTSNQLIIEHVPNREDKHIIPLPAIVKKRGSKARYKDGTLEIKIPKDIDMQFSEIEVSDNF